MATLALDRPIDFNSTFSCPSSGQLARLPEAALAEQTSEGDLIRMVTQGRKEAFALLVRPYQRMLFVSAVSILGNDFDAEEVVQEAIFKAFRALPRFRQESKFSTWLVQIVLNEAKMRLRKDRRHLWESLDDGYRADDGDYIPREFPDWRELPSQALENQQLRTLLVQALQSLPAKYRAVLVMRDIQHLSITETAQVLKLTEANVKTRLCRARLKMRDALASDLQML